RAAAARRGEEAAARAHAGQLRRERRRPGPPHAPALSRARLGEPAVLTGLRREAAQIGEISRDSDRGKRRRSRSYVESPQGGIAAQIAEMRGRSSSSVRNAG